MEARNLIRETVYLYVGGAINTPVMYVGTEPKGYVFKAYNDSTNLFDGFKNVLCGRSVREYIEEQ